MTLLDFFIIELLIAFEEITSSTFVLEPIFLIPAGFTPVVSSLKEICFFVFLFMGFLSSNKLISLLTLIISVSEYFNLIEVLKLKCVYLFFLSKVPIDLLLVFNPALISVLSLFWEVRRVFSDLYTTLVLDFPFVLKLSSFLFCFLTT